VSTYPTTEFLFFEVAYSLLKKSPKWIKDLHIRPQTLKLVQERVGNTLELIGIGKDFLNGTPAAQQLREHR
jgi:hypothetical protein